MRENQCSGMLSSPGVAWAVLQTPCYSLHWFNKWLTHSSIVKISSKLLHSQTVRARDLKLWDNVHHPLCVTCHMSLFTYKFSHVRCHFTAIFIDILKFSYSINHLLGCFLLYLLKQFIIFSKLKYFNRSTAQNYYWLVFYEDSV